MSLSCPTTLANHKPYYPAHGILRPHIRELETGTSDIECLSDDADDGDEEVVIIERIQDEEEANSGENENSSDDENENSSYDENETINNTEGDEILENNYEWVALKKLVECAWIPVNPGGICISLRRNNRMEENANYYFHDKLL
ncbi:hypothetical protein JTB14_022573 [Gonioctena quinquepunctata]|nr:hypothetical protein JTB14_022573 [Gonioctena quinquepunctata]